MPYRLELYNNDNTTRLGQLKDIQNPRVSYELEGQFVLSFEIINTDDLYSTIAGRNYVRMINIDNSSDYYYFIIQPGIKEKVAGGKIYKQVQCENIIYELANNIIPIKKMYQNITAAQAISIALGGSGFTLGTNDIPSSNVQTIEFDWPTSLAALHQIIDTWYYDDAGTIKRYYLDITQAKVINIRTLANLGTARTFYVHPDKNLIDLDIDTDYTNMANRIYAVGQDGFTIYRAGATLFEFVDIVSTAGGGGDNYIIVAEETIETDEYNGVQVYIFAGTGYDQLRTVSDSVAVAGIVVSPNWTTNPNATSQYCLGAAIVSYPCTYVLGTLGADTRSATLGTYIQIIVGAHCYWGVGDSGQTLTFVVTIEALDNSDNVLVSQSQTVVQDQAIGGSLASNSMEFNLMVGEITTIRKIKMTLNSATFTGTANGRPFVGFTSIKYSLSDNLPYVEDTTAQATYGVVVGKYENANIPDVINLVDSPALDGTYTGGLCANWVKVGTPTTTENTDTDFITHGVKSQKVVNDAANEGIYTRVYGFRSNVSYSLYVLVYINPDEPGVIDVTLDPIGALDNTTAQISGGGWVSLKIENFSYDFSGSAGEPPYIDLMITSPGTAVTYYIDAAQINEGIESLPFYAGDSADILYGEAINDLSRRKDPETSYNLNMIDLYAVDPISYSGDYFKPGDTVRLVHRDLALDSNILVVAKDYNPLDPGVGGVRLGNKNTMLRKTLLKYMADIAVRQRLT